MGHGSSWYAQTTKPTGGVFDTRYDQLGLTQLNGDTWGHPSWLQVGAAIAILAAFAMIFNKFVYPKKKIF
jgi:hypothetical protein